MNFIDCLLLTLVNITICITLPKLLSLILAPKTANEQLKPIAPQKVESKTPTNKGEGERGRWKDGEMGRKINLESPI